jgi:hypothetical protein
MSKLSELNVTLTNKTVLLDVSHVKQQGDELVQGGIVVGKVFQSEVPTYGYVVAFDPAIETLKVGDVVPIAQPGSLRVFDWPEKPKDQKIVSIRFEFIDGVISQESK